MIRTIDDAYINVIRQSFFTLFERDAHKMLVEGCSFDELANHYLANLGEQFGDAVELSDEFRWEWIAVPHFFNEPFYTYAYSFGQLLVLSLYQQYRLEGAAFIPRYLKILSYGGSEAPTKILSEAGLDITAANFWQAGFDVINEMLTELIKIA
jgi:oligoendopeptidase F